MDGVYPTFSNPIAHPSFLGLYKELATFSKEGIAQALVTMLAAGQVQTSISRRGNTLYGLRR